MPYALLQTTLCRLGGLLYAPFLTSIALFAFCSPAPAEVIFETTSPYHHILVVDWNGIRSLRFDDAQESRMSLIDPLKGHFEYTEYFHMPWLWNTQMVSVLMVGLGGGTTQRLFEHYYTNVNVETVEIDPAVLQVARNYFHFKESAHQKVHLEDGRVFLRRSTNRHDLIIMDAYVQGRYGSSIPPHLTTTEFFQLARDHLTTNGVLAYNIIGNLKEFRPEIVGAMYRTINTVFPQVYVFPAHSSQNVVLVATMSATRFDLRTLRYRAAQLVQSGRVALPTFRNRVEAFIDQPPASARRSPVLTDDYAPVESLTTVR